MTTSNTDRIIENAAAYIRRLSPEGQAQARRARERRTARVKRAIKGCAVSTLGWGAGVGIVDWMGLLSINPVSLGVNALTITGIWAFNIFATRDKTAPPPEMPKGPKHLVTVVEEAQNWYSAFRDLPTNINIYSSFSNLSEAVKGLTTDSPEAALIQTLLCEDLRKLVDNYMTIPLNLRKKAQGNELTPYEHLCEGIQVIKLEMDKLIFNLGKRETAALEQQNAYLSLKYGPDRTEQA